MPFNRPPRLQTPLPTDVVKIPEPPAIPAKPDATNWLTVILPLGAVLLSVVLMVVFMGNSSSGLNYLLFIPIMLVSYLVAIITSRSQKKNYAKKVLEGQIKYRETLDIIENNLSHLKKNEKRIRLSINPDPEECFTRASEIDPRLGERRPDDPDFLLIRLGLGKSPASYTVEVPPKEEPEEFAEEFKTVRRLVSDYSVINDVPIQVRFPRTGSIGIAGQRAEVLEAVYAICAQLLTHHWPTEVQLAAVGSPAGSRDWKWLRQIPHISPLQKSATSHDAEKTAEPPSTIMAALEIELQRREQLVEASKISKKNDAGGRADAPLPRLVVIFDYLPLAYQHPALNLLQRKGRELGVFGIFLTELEESIPGECGGVITIENGRLAYSESGVEGYRRDGLADGVTLNEMDNLIRDLGDIEWPGQNDTSLPPDTITFLQLFNVTRVEQLPLESWWEDHSPYGYLRAPIGRISATSDMIFDLNDRDGAHGPHGLLGGMTGSGKSEVLKAIILALAVTHHPYDLNFALIDFKGGAAFNELARLPHTVGVVTDIESNATFAERVIQALSGEIERRKRVLENARAAFRFGRSHIDEYRNQRVRRPMPRLVIVFDEFAEFKQRNPVESKKLISIARQGRSLGVHLILATQNIEAAVDPEILQNSSFRICLKVSEPQDSMQMIGIPDAINLTRGRAYFSSNSRTLYQSAFSGAHYVPVDDSGPQNSFVRIWPDGRREVMDIPKGGDESSKGGPPSTEASAVVEQILAVTRRLHLKKPPAVWPDALPERLYLPDLIARLLTGGWDGQEWHPCQVWGAPSGLPESISPVLGLVDMPAKQQQYPLQVGSNQGGHLLVFGSAGSGKSTLLRTLVTSIALTQPPSKAHFYILDFGGQSALKPLETLPHVGAVVTRLETERAKRLVQLIRTQVNRRNELLRDNHVDSWQDYNTLSTVTEADRLPALYLVIDGFRDFKQTFDNEFIDSVTALVSGGQAAGLSLITATSLQADIPNDLFANINMRLSFNQADSTEYFRIVGQPSEAKTREDAAKGVRPGRSLLRGTPPIEFQAALPTFGETDKDQAGNLIALAAQMKAAWHGKHPDPVRTLPLLVTLPQTAALAGVWDSNYWSMLGNDFDEILPIGFSLVQDGPAFLVGSVSEGCGKTSLLISWLLDLAQHYSGEKLQTILIDFHTRTLGRLRRLPIVKNYVGNRSALSDVLSALQKEIEERQHQMDQAFEQNPEFFNPQPVLEKWPHILVIIDDYERFHQVMGGEFQQLTDCIQRGGDLGISFIIAAKISDLPNSYNDHFVEKFRKIGCGVLLGGIEGIDEYNNTRRPSGLSFGILPSGRGYIIRRGNVKLFQAAAYWEKDQNEIEALEQRVNAVSLRH